MKDRGTLGPAIELIELGHYPDSFGLSEEGGSEMLDDLIRFAGVFRLMPTADSRLFLFPLLAPPSSFPCFSNSKKVLGGSVVPASPRTFLSN